MDFIVFDQLTRHPFAWSLLLSASVYATSKSPTMTNASSRTKNDEHSNGSKGKSRCLHMNGDHQYLRRRDAAKIRMQGTRVTPWVAGWLSRLDLHLWARQCLAIRDMCARRASIPPSCVTTPASVCESDNMCFLMILHLWKKGSKRCLGLSQAGAGGQMT